LDEEKAYHKVMREKYLWNLAKLKLAFKRYFL